MRADSWRYESVPLLVLVAVYAAALRAFFGRYAFDDSYVGYGVAQSLLHAGGFSFNAHAHVLSTSSPLAPLLYVPVAFVLHGDVVFAAQLWSAAAFAIVVFGGYALARTVSARIGALIAVIIAAGSPFLLLLWSHETLLCCAVCIIGALLYSQRRVAAAAVVLGLAVLLRGEALLLLPLFWRRGGLRFAALSLAPFVLWCALAYPLFGTPFSSTIASKHAQLLYGEITPYLEGLRDYVTRMYAITPSFAWSRIVEVSSALAALCALLCRKSAYVYIVIWMIATTAVYVVFQLPFYFWFCSQFAVAMAAGAAYLWPKTGTMRYELLASLGRGAAIVLAAIDAAFIALQLVQPERMMQSYDWIVMPRIAFNAYRALGEHFRDPRYAASSIGYPEIGQLHYYSGVTVIDYLGIAEPDAVRALRRNDAVWTYERYVPDAIIDTTNFRYFLDVREYDWFARAYRARERVDVAGDPTRSHFTVYRLYDRAAVPPPLLPLSRNGFLRFQRGPHAIIALFAPPADAGGAELRMRLGRPCSRVALSLSGPGVRRKEVRRSVPASVVRFSLRARLRARTPYAFAVAACGGVLPAPAQRLRGGFTVFGKPAPPPARPADALALFSEETTP